MNLKKRLKAFLFRRNEPIELDLIAAEIKNGKAFLHPRADRSVTYLVRSDDIEIHLSKGKSLDDEDIVLIERTPEHTNSKQAPTDSSSVNHRKADANSVSSAPDTYNLDKYKKKKFYVSLYPDEYDSLMASMKEYGYKRSDFVLACVNTATKGTMEREHKKILRNHSELRREQKTSIERQLP